MRTWRSLGEPDASDGAIRYDALSALTRQGRVAEAQDHLLRWLADPLLRPDDADAFRMALAGNRVDLGLQFAAAVSEAEDILETARRRSAGAVELARLDVEASRIVRRAVIYLAVDDARGEAAAMRLGEAVAVLDGAGLAEEALLARLLGLKADIAAPWAAAEALARDAAAAGFPEIAGHALAQLALTSRQSGGDPAIVTALLDRSKGHYDEAGHLTGPLQVRRLRALVDDDRGIDAVPALVDLLKAHDAAEDPLGRLITLLDLFEILAACGIAHRAPDLLKELEEVPARLGSNAIGPNNVLRLGETLQRRGDFSAAMALYDTILAQQPPASTAALVRAQMGNAYLLLGLPAAAAQCHADARTLIDRLPAGPRRDALLPALGAAPAPAFDIAGWAREATAVLEGGDRSGSAERMAALVDRLITRNEAPSDIRSVPLLTALADTLIDRAVPLTAALPWRRGRHCAGGLLMNRGQLRAVAGDVAAARDAWQAAADTYASAQLHRDHAIAANLVGIAEISMEHDQRQISPHFGAAISALEEALGYFDEVGMQPQAIKARTMLAHLRLRAVERVPDASSEVPQALADLRSADLALERLRAEYRRGSVVDTQAGRIALGGLGTRLYDLAVGRNCADGRFAEAWDWARRGKSRVLLDLLSQATTATADGPAGRSQADAIERSRPSSADLLAAVGGTAPVVIADWRMEADRVWLFTIRSGDAEPVGRLVRTAPDAVMRFVTDFLLRDASGFFRDKTDQRRFYELETLIEPLGSLLRPGDRLLLSPSGVMGRLPLHALRLDGEPLLARHALAYVPSPDALISLSARPPLTADRVSAFLGDPTGDRPGARATAAAVAAALGVSPLLGEAVSRAAVADALASADLVHFQGHAEFDAADPLMSHLVLHDGVLTAKDLFKLPRGRARLIVLAACQSAVGQPGPGDDSLGLLRAFFYGGAQAVLGTLWNVPDAVAASVVRTFYETLLGTAPARRPSPAEALRDAILSYRSDNPAARLYHWAPFYISGLAL